MVNVKTGDGPLDGGGPFPLEFVHCSQPWPGDRFMRTLILPLAILLFFNSYAQRPPNILDDLRVQIERVLLAQYGLGDQVKVIHHSVGPKAFGEGVRKLHDALAAVQEESQRISLKGLKNIFITGQAEFKVVERSRPKGEFDLHMPAFTPADALYSLIGHHVALYRQARFLRQKAEQILKDAHNYRGGGIFFNPRDTQSADVIAVLEQFRRALEGEDAVKDFEGINRIFFTNASVRETKIQTYQRTDKIDLFISRTTPGPEMMPALAAELYLYQLKKRILQKLVDCCQYQNRDRHIVVGGNLRREDVVATLEQLDRELSSANFKLPLETFGRLFLSAVSDEIAIHSRGNAWNDLSLPVRSASELEEEEEGTAPLLPRIAAKIEQHHRLQDLQEEILQLLQQQYGYQGKAASPERGVGEDDFLATLQGLREGLLEEGALPGMKSIAELVVHGGEDVEIMRISSRSQRLNGRFQLFLPAGVEHRGLWPLILEKLHYHDVMNKTEILLRERNYRGTAGPTASGRVEAQKFSQAMEHLGEALRSSDLTLNFSNVSTISISKDEGGVWTRRYRDESLGLYISTDVAPEFLAPLIYATLLSPEQLADRLARALKERGFRGSSPRGRSSLGVSLTDHLRAMAHLWVSLHTSRLNVDLSSVKSLLIGKTRGRIWNPSENAFVVPHNLLTEIPSDAFWARLVLPQIRAEVENVLVNLGHRGLIRPSWSSGQEDFARGMGQLWSALKSEGAEEQLNSVGGFVVINQIFIVSERLESPWAYYYPWPVHEEEKRVNLYIPADTDADDILPFMVSAIQE